MPFVSKMDERFVSGQVFRLQEHPSVFALIGADMQLARNLRHRHVADGHLAGTVDGEASVGVVVGRGTHGEGGLGAIETNQ